MNIFQRAASWATGAIQKAGQVLRFTPAWGIVTWWDANFATHIQKGYKGSSAVSNCVRALAFSFPEPPLIAFRDTPEGEQPAGANDPLQKLIHKPNPDMGEAELMQFVITYASCGGDIYLWKERTKNGKVIYLWPFSDQDIITIPGRDNLEGLVAGYAFDVGDGQKIYLDKNDVIQWKWMIDPEKPWQGIGAIEFCLRDVQNDTESSRFSYSMFKNNAIPPVVVTLTEGDELTEAKARRLRKSWIQRYGRGNEDPGAPAFLEAGMTVQKLGLNMQELTLSELKNIPESRICGAFGVPPSIALLYVGLKRSDYGDANARKSFTETTLVALWRSFASEMTSGLSDEFGGGYTLRFDQNQVAALQENVNEKWTRFGGAVNKGLITRADFKRGVGLKVLPGDNVYQTSLLYSWEEVGAEPQPLISAGGGAAKATKPLSQKELGGAKPAGVSVEMMERAKRVRHAEPLLETKSRAAMAVYGRTLQRIRKAMQPSMSKDLDGYFTKLSDRVVSRAGKSLQALVEKKDDLPKPDDILTPKDEAELEKVITRWFISIGEASWETINLAIGVTAAFDMTDPAITAMLAKSGMDVKEITATTRAALRDALKYGNENGWSIQQLVKGDENQAGIRSIVKETYQNRSEAIARTELGNAQNAVASERYKANGISLVGILDDGEEDDDDECKVANGQVWTLDYFEENRLEHPNCTRCSYPIFEDVTPDQG